MAVELWHFGTLSVSAPLANMILTPLASLVLVPLGFLGSCLAGISQVPLDIAAKGAMYFCGLADGISEKLGYVWIAGRAEPNGVCVLLCLLPLRLKIILPMLACLLAAFVSDLQPRHYRLHIYRTGRCVSLCPTGRRPHRHWRRISGSKTHQLSQT